MTPSPYTIIVALLVALQGGLALVAGGAIPNAPPLLIAAQPWASLANTILTIFLMQLKQSAASARSAGAETQRLRNFIPPSSLMALLLLLAACAAPSGGPPARLARESAPAPTITAVTLADGADLRYQSANGALSGAYGPNAAEITCATPTDTATSTATPSATASDTASPTPSGTNTPPPSETPTQAPTASDTATAVPSDTPTPTSTAPPSDTPTPPPPSATPTLASTPTPTRFAGNLGWLVSTNSATWNSLMRAQDRTALLYPSLSGYTQVTRGLLAVALQPTLVNGAISDPVNAATLSAIDVAAQAAHGKQTEIILYADDQFSDTVANKIARLQTDVAFIHGYARLGGAPPFLVYYVPAGPFLDTNLAANPQIRTVPDGNILQSQVWEDTPAGADPTFVATVTRNVQALRALDSAKPLGVQLQTYSKSNPAVVWTVAKLQADLEAVGALGPTWVTFYYATPQNAALSFQTLQSLLALYRP